MSKHYISCLGGPGVVRVKNALGHITSNMCFCIRWDLRVTWCIPVYPGHETLTQYFSCSGGPNAVSIKSEAQPAGTLYAKLLFLHPV
jgi:hypothetical protein